MSLGAETSDGSASRPDAAADATGRPAGLCETRAVWVWVCPVVRVRVSAEGIACPAACRAATTTASSVSVDASCARRGFMFAPMERSRAVASAAAART